MPDAGDVTIVNYSTEWSDEDLQDFSRAGWELINKRLEEEEAGSTELIVDSS